MIINSHESETWNTFDRFQQTVLIHHKVYHEIIVHEKGEQNNLFTFCMSFYIIQKK